MGSIMIEENVVSAAGALIDLLLKVSKIIFKSWFYTKVKKPALYERKMPKIEQQVIDY